MVDPQIARWARRIRQNNREAKRRIMSDMSVTLVIPTPTGSVEIGTIFDPKRLKPVRPGECAHERVDCSEAACLACGLELHRCFRVSTLKQVELAVKTFLKIR
jgi:hypothetical protein